MIKPKIVVKPSKMFLANCKMLPVKMREAVKKATLITAYQIHNQAKILCPVDTGRLRASISVNWTGSGLTYGKVEGKTMAKAGRKPSSASDGVGQPPKEIGGFYASVGTNVEYGEDVENYISPYLWPAFAMNKEKYRATMAAILGTALKL